MFSLKKLIEERRNSASVVELHRATNLAVQRKKKRSPFLRRSHSCKEEQNVPSYVKPPYPCQEDQQSPQLGTSNKKSRALSDGDLKVQKSKNHRHGRTSFSTPQSDSKNNIFENPSMTNSSESIHIGLPEERVIMDLEVDDGGVCNYFDNDSTFGRINSKILLLGSSGVGKTCLTTKFKDGIYLSGSYIPTLGIDTKSKIMSLDDQKIHLQLWDASGRRKYHSMLPPYCAEADGVVLVFDVNDRGSFEDLQEWLPLVRETARDEAVVMLCGNKCDVEEADRSVSRAEGEALALQQNLPYVETSPRAAINVGLIMTVIVRQLISGRCLPPAKFDVRSYIIQKDATILRVCSMCRLC